MKLIAMLYRRLFPKKGYELHGFLDENGKFALTRMTGPMFDENGRLRKDYKPADDAGSDER